MSQPTTGFTSTLEQTAKRYAESVEAHESRALSPLLSNWERVRSGVQADLDALLARVAEAKAAGEALSPSWLYRERRYRALIETVNAEVARYATQVGPYVQNMQQDVAEQARAQAASLVEAGVTRGIGATVAFTVAQPATLETLAGFLAPGSPLQALIDDMGPETAAGLRGALLQGIVRGKGPAWIARKAGVALDLPRRRAVTIARTEGARVYNAVTRGVYQENADVLEGWEWVASLDKRSCVACIVMHGTIHPLTDTLDGHPNCRCAMSPRTRSLADLLGDPSIPDTQPPRGRGMTWLRRQSAADQREIMGPVRYRAFKAGEISLSDMVARSRDPQWGSMRRERSLLEIREGRNANVMPKVEPPQERPRTTRTPEVVPEPVVVPQVAQRPAEARPALVYDGKAEWARWGKGRDRNMTPLTPAERERYEAALPRYETNLAEARDNAATAKAAVKQHQDRLKVDLPDAAQRAAYAKADPVLAALKERAATMNRMVKTEEEALAYIQGRLDAGAPVFNPDNPLEFYGNQVVTYGTKRATVTHQGLRDLEEHVSPDQHRVVQEWFTGRMGAGVHIGTVTLPKLDGLMGLATQRTSDGRGWSGVGGVMSGERRVVAVAGSGNYRHEVSWTGVDGQRITFRHTSVMVHEFGHGLDMALGHARRTRGGAATIESATPEFMAVNQRMLGTRPDNYFTPVAHTGAADPARSGRMEMFTQSYQAWARTTGYAKRDRARAILESIDSADKGPSALDAAEAMVDYLDGMDARLARTLGS